MESTAEIENLGKLVRHYKGREESKWSKLIEQSEEDKKSLEKLTSKVSVLEQEKKSLTDYLKQEEERFKTFGNNEKHFYNSKYNPPCWQGLKYWVCISCIGVRPALKKKRCPG